MYRTPWWRLSASCLVAALPLLAFAACEGVKEALTAKVDSARTTPAAPANHWHAVWPDDKLVWAVDSARGVICYRYRDGWREADPISCVPWR